jgi:REP element-mobilizing transposase RayT
MAQSLVKNYLHIIFSTKHRETLIDEMIERELHSYLGGICKKLECFPVKIGGYTDHIHLLCMLSKKITLIKLLEDLKSDSSKWVKTIHDRYKNFYWQNGYGAFSVSPSDVATVKHYIEMQHEHHKTWSFQDEYRKILNEHQIEFDERYVWD